MISSSSWVLKIVGLAEENFGRKIKELVMMEEIINMKKVEGLDELPPPAYSIVIAVAISGSKKTKYVVRWALEKFVPEGHVYFKLLHVHHVISRIPTPMGNHIPICQVREDVATAFRKEVDLHESEKLLPYKQLCTQRNVQADIVQIESDDVIAAIAGEIRKHNITKLVIGASSHHFFSRAATLSSKISESCPAFCTVYAVSRGKLSSVRPSDSESNICLRDDISEKSCSTDNSSSHTSSSQTEWTDQGSDGTFSYLRSASLPVQRLQSLANINQTLLPSQIVTRPRNSSIDLGERSNDTSSIHSSSSGKDHKLRPFCSFRSSMADNPFGDQPSTSDSFYENQANVNFELEKLRIELRHVRGMYAMAQGEAFDASRKLNELHKRRMEEGLKLKQIGFKEADMKEFCRQDKERYEAVIKDTDFLKLCNEDESRERQEVENKASRRTKENQNLESVLDGSFSAYRQFAWEEIVSATSSFSDELKIGVGAYGTVYKCSFQHTTAAVKVLHAKETSRTKQFLQELEILSKIHHPHLLMLLGACPDHGCLVYEFMENGSLEDQLLCKNDSHPLSWFDRYRIAWEVGSALEFLHNAKPSIIHRDLKPGNILLDSHYVSKIGDVGLSKMLNKDALAMSTTCKDTAPVGTFCYIDPEYQRTGKLSLKSDVYAFGIVILQLITGRPAIGLAHMVEVAMGKDRLEDVFDTKAGVWPIEETKILALMSLRCTELRQRDRPDLEDEVLPLLEKLEEFAEKSRNLMLVLDPLPPCLFICPILKEVMSDPCVAADGYTYDRKGIEAWLEENDTSPMTKLAMPHKHIIPNYTLLSAIMEWKSARH